MILLPMPSCLGLVASSAECMLGCETSVATKCVPSTPLWQVSHEAPQISLKGVYCNARVEGKVKRREEKKQQCGRRGFLPPGPDFLSPWCFHNEAEPSSVVEAAFQFGMSRAQSKSESHH